MDKYNLITTLILVLYMISGLRGEDDVNDGVSSRLTERSNRQSDIKDQKSTTKTNISENTGDGQIKQNVSDKRSDYHDNRSYNNSQYNRNNNGYNSRGAAYNYGNNRGNNENINYDRNRIGYDNSPYKGNRGYDNPPPPAWSSPPLARSVNPNLKEFRTGLSFGTLKILSTLPNCDQQTLLNYHHLLRNPTIRLQFYRDLYQINQRNYLDGCGEGMVRVGHRERAILLRDPYFRKKVEILMTRQPIGAAIRGPVRYPNDINISQ